MAMKYMDKPQSFQLGPLHPGHRPALLAGTRNCPRSNDSI
jgi:hypothetical protein